MKKNLLWLLLAAFCLIQTAAAQEPIPAASRGYLLGPGDEIAAKVLGEPQFDFTATVNENGNIEVPFFDKPVRVMCLSERELRTEVTQLLSKYLRTPQVSIAVTARKSRAPVTVSGEVRNQQQVVLTRKTRLLELISFSGGITEDAGGMIQIFRITPPLCAEPGELEAWRAETDNVMGAVSRMYSLSNVQQGKDESNPVVYPGDIVVVPKGSPVYIVGEIKSGQGNLMLKEGGLPLSQAIAMVGGVSRDAKSKDVKIYRRKTDSIDREILTANLDSIKKGQQKDLMLAPYDIVEVDKTKESIAKTILKIATGAGTTGITTLISGGAARILY